MKKLYLGFMLLGAVGFGLQSQAQSSIREAVKSFPNVAKSNFTGNLTGDCDTMFVPETWNLKVYTVSDQNGNFAGFLTGTNADQPSQLAQHFDLSAQAYNYVSGFNIYFAYANSNKSASLSKKISFKILADKNGQPGSMIGDSAYTTLGELKKDVDGNFLTQITFPTPVNITNNKKFFATIDYKALTWSTGGLGTKDSLSVVSSDQAQDNNGWVNLPLYGGWGTYEDYYGVGFGVFIEPYVSTSETGCAVMPVRLISFNAERKNNDVTLSWKIADEMNMGHYEVERADNNGQFKTVATVNALNMLKEQTYTVTDKNAFNTASTVQYRLKQVDGDGTIQYSRTISVKAAGLITDVVFQNPISSNLKIQLNLATAQNVSVGLYNMQGSLVSSIKNKMCNASNNTLDVNTAQLQSGMYILKINAGTEQVVYKVVKQ